MIETETKLLIKPSYKIRNVTFQREIGCNCNLRDPVLQIVKKIFEIEGILQIVQQLLLHNE